MIKNLSWYLMIGWSLCCSIVWGQSNIVFDQLSLQDGLSQATVYTIYQDSEGFIWLGTKDGLNRYDGYEFHVYKNNPKDPKSLSQNSVRSIYEDSQKRLWLATELGINLFDPKTETFRHFEHDENNKNTLSNNAVRDMVEDDDGVFWIATSGGGLNALTIQNDSIQFQLYLPDSTDSTSISHAVIRDLHKDQNGTIWLATDGGLDEMVKKGGKVTFNHYRHVPNNANSLVTDEINQITEDKQGNLWLGTWGYGIEKMVRNEKKIRFEHFSDDPSNPQSIAQSYIISLEVDSKNRLWVGTWGNGVSLGTIKLDGTVTFEHYKHDPFDQKSLCHNSIRSIYEDKSGTIWIGTYGNGISRTMPYIAQFNHIESNRINQLSSNDIWAFTVDVAKDWWVGTWDGGLNRLKDGDLNNTFELFDPTTPIPLPSNKITNLLEDKEGNIWIGTWGKGVYKIQFNTNREVTGFQSFPILYNGERELRYNNINTLYEDSRGGIWVGTRKGLHRLDYKGGIGKWTDFYPESSRTNSLSRDDIQTLCEDKEGNLYIGTSWGGLNRAKLDDLYQLSPSKVNFEHFKYDPTNPNSISSNSINTLFIDSRGRLWVGAAGGGLNLLDKKNQIFRHYAELQGLPNTVILAIQEDNKGYLWIASNKGLSKFDMNNHTFRNYDSRDGLQSNQFTRNASYKDVEGNLFWGGINGFNVFHPTGILDNSFVPPVVFTDFKLINKSVQLDEGGVLTNHINYTDEITLSYKDKVITFEFAALNYILSEKNRFAYRLKGFDDIWRDIGNQRLITFTNLDPQTYILEIKGTNNDGIWNDKAKTIQLIITPPFWKTWWFRLLGIFGIIIGILYYIRYRLRSVQAEKEKLERLVLERTAEILKQKQLVEEKSQFKEQFFSNVSHELRTPLNGILGMSHLLMKTKLDQSQQQFTGAIKSSADNLLVIINDLLDISKINAGKLQLLHKPFDVLNLFSSIFELMQVKADEKNVDLIFDIDKTTPQWLEGDKVRLYQIIINLLGNALKFTMDGYVLLKIKVAKRSNTSIQLALQFKDTGIGIPEEKLSNIFNSYAQVIDESGYHYEGSGLGLSIVQNLVQLYGGSIRVDSTLGEGSTFFVELPFIIPTKQNIDIHLSTQENQIFKRKWQGKKVLLLEDNKVNQLYAKNLFVEWELNADVAENILEATQSTTQYKYDCILADVKLPDGNGLEFVKTLQQNDKHLNHNTPIIVLTAGASIEQQERAENLNIQRYMTKPFEPLALASELNKIFETNDYDALTVNQENTVDYKYLERLSKLMRYNKNHIVELIEIFLEQLPEAKQKIQIGINTENWEEVHFEAHKLKSPLKTIGLTELADLISAISTQSANRQNLHEIPPIFNNFTIKCALEEVKLANELRKLKAEIERLSLV